MENEYRFEVYTEFVAGEKEYIVKYLDFDTVIGCGTTKIEAIEEAEANLEFYLEYCKDNNIVIPKPSKHEELDYSGKVTIRMSKTLHKAIDARAKKEGVSLNAFMCEALNNYVVVNNFSDMLVAKCSEKIATEAQETIDRQYEYKLNQLKLEKNEKQLSNYFEKKTKTPLCA